MSDQIRLEDIGYILKDSNDYVYFRYNDDPPDQYDTDKIGLHRITWQEFYEIRANNIDDDLLILKNNNNPTDIKYLKTTPEPPMDEDSWNNFINGLLSEGYAQITWQEACAIVDEERIRNRPM